MTIYDRIQHLKLHNLLLLIISPEGYFQKSWVGVCSPLPKTLTLFSMIKLCDIPYPTYDLTMQIFDTLFMT